MASGTSTTDALGPGERPLLVVILGPTAVGKTARAIELAQALGTEIINADSRQIYKGMSIGTAQPTATEREMAAHHFVDFINVEDRYSAGQFEADTMSWLNKWFQSHKTAVMSGGSGLYLKAVLDGLDEMPVDLDIRSSLNARHKKEGVEALAAELADLDPAHAANMDLHNPQRVIRALEVCLVSGKPFSSFHKKSKTERPFDVLTVGLQMNRDELVNRINLRVDNMVQEGLKHEAALMLSKEHLNALQTVGYREWFAHFNGQCSETEAIERIKVHTRQFAKRQMTWFKRMENIQWVNAFDTKAIENIVEEACRIRSWTLHRPFSAID